MCTPHPIFSGDNVENSSKKLSVVIHTVKHNYTCLYYYNEGSDNDMFRPYMWTIFRL